MAMFSSYVELPDGIIFIYLDGITYVFTYIVHRISEKNGATVQFSRRHLEMDDFNWTKAIGLGDVHQQ